MSIHFLAPDLSRWDQVSADALALSFFADERPLRGAAGLADWRLCARISRLLRAGKLSGREGETLLLPPAGQRLSFSRVVLFGMGDSRQWSEQRFRAGVQRIRDVLHRARVSRFALQLPGRATGLMTPRRALEIWLEGCDPFDLNGNKDDVIFIETPSGQKEMAELVRVRPGM
ncbi:MAG: hypothetical protein HY698_05660 [Deltaproteobacteria bacterium]|nr:hypothetical protein [Deltaproteobacteria bacterium]